MRLSKCLSSGRLQADLSRAGVLWYSQIPPTARNLLFTGITFNSGVGAEVLTARRASTLRAHRFRFGSLCGAQVSQGSGVRGQQMAKGLAADVRDSSFIAALLYLASEFAG